jgi:hypothetical protein
MKNICNILLVIGAFSGFFINPFFGVLCVCIIMFFDKSIV